MLIEWITGEGRTRKVLDQIVAIRDERPRNVWMYGSTISDDDTVSYRYALTTGLCNGDVAPPTLTCCIAVNGAKGDISLTTRTEDATTLISSRIAGNSAVGEDECSLKIINAAAAHATSCSIAGNSTIAEGKRAFVVDATTTDEFGIVTRRSIVRDSAVGEDEPV